MKLCHVYLFHNPMLYLPFAHMYAVAPCLLFPRCCTISTFSTLLSYVYSVHTAATCLLFPCCCAMSTVSSKLHPVILSTLLCNVYFYNACAMSPLYVAVLCLLFPQCYASLLFHAVATCLFFPHVVLCLHFPHGCAMSSISTLLYHR